MTVTAPPAWAWEERTDEVGLGVKVRGAYRFLYIGRMDGWIDDE